MLNQSRGHTLTLQPTWRFPRAASAVPRRRNLSHCKCRETSERERELFLRRQLWRGIIIGGGGGGGNDDLRSRGRGGSEARSVRPVGAAET